MSNSECFSPSISNAVTIQAILTMLRLMVTWYAHIGSQRPIGTVVILLRILQLEDLSVGAGLAWHSVILESGLADCCTFPESGAPTQSSAHDRAVRRVGRRQWGLMSLIPPGSLNGATNPATVPKPTFTSTTYCDRPRSLSSLARSPRCCQSNHHYHHHYQQ